MTSTTPRKLGLLDTLACLCRTYAVPKESLVMQRPFWQDDRHCFVAPLPPEWLSDADGESPVVLLEDGQPLGPAHCNHDDVRTLGRGRYSHWGTQLFFSSSDHSDPNTNGRHYSLLPPDGWNGVLPSPAAALSDRDMLTRSAVTWDIHEIHTSSFTHVVGKQYQFTVPGSWASDAESLSTAILLEDEVPLPFPHALHREIPDLGQGRYSHWGQLVLFSTPDGSDPRTNGRNYAVAHAEALLFAHATASPVNVDGHAWVLHDLPTHWISDATGASRVMLLEDGEPLGPAHSSHDDVRERGHGAFSHWGREFYFSTSDGSDPNTNGRTYALVLSD